MIIYKLNFYDLALQKITFAATVIINEQSTITAFAVRQRKYQIFLQNISQFTARQKT